MKAQTKKEGFKMKYDKEYYNKIVSEIILDLINKKDELVGDIEEITTYIDDRENCYDLSKIDIELINKGRLKMATIYKLIDDLQELNR
jgi:hypothetical protein